MPRMWASTAMLLLSLPALSAQESRQAAVQNSEAAKSPGGLRLVNENAVPLRVEIRLTSSRGCDGPIIAKTTVFPQAATRISLPEAVCIRRESLEEGTPRFRVTWERKEVTLGVVTEVRL